MFIFSVMFKGIAVVCKLSSRNVCVYVQFSGCNIISGRCCIHGLVWDGNLHGVLLLILRLYLSFSQERWKINGHTSWQLLMYHLLNQVGSNRLVGLVDNKYNFLCVPLMQSLSCVPFSLPAALNKSLLSSETPSW